MFIKRRNNQSGLMLMEIILAMAIIAAFFSGILIMMQKQEKVLKNKTTASYISEVLSAAENYVKDNISDITFVDNVSERSLSNLSARGYLSRDFGANTPYKSQIKIALVKKKEKLYIFAMMLADSNKLNYPEIAANIPNGRGGIFFSAASEANPCGGVACIKGVYDLWQYNLDGPLATYIGTEYAASIPDQMIIAFKAIENEYEPYLSRYKTPGALSNNTINTDFNLEGPNEDNKNVGIFFNPEYILDSLGENSVSLLSVKAPASLLYIPSSGNVADDNYIEPKVILDRLQMSGSVSRQLEGYDENAQQPLFSSSGGISSGLIIEKEADDTYPLCNEVGLVALDKDSNFLQCKSTGEKWKKFTKSAMVKYDPLDPQDFSTASAILLRVTYSFNTESYVVLVDKEVYDNINDTDFTNISILGYME